MMRVGIIGTGAIANKHAEAYRNVGFEVAACSDQVEQFGRAFAARWNAQFVAGYGELCRWPGLDFVDVCTFPDFRLEPVEACAVAGRSVLVRKPMATNLAAAKRMMEVAAQARHCAGCGQPAPLRRLDGIPEAGDSGRTPGQASRSGCVCEMVSRRRLLLAADQGKLAHRGRWRANQPGDSSG